MSTYAELQQRISDDYLNRTDFSNQIKRALLAAVRFYERRRWRFNETATALATVIGQSYLTLPSNYLFHDKFQVSAVGALMDIIPTNLDTVLTLRATSAVGFPTHFAVSQNRFEIALVPDSAYSCPLHYIKSLDVLSADTDSNAWTNGLHQDLIVYHATKMLWSNTLRNMQEAQKYQVLEVDVRSQLSMDNLQFFHLGLTPTNF